MKDIYLQLWELAKPYYVKGRPMDVAHIEWFMMEASRIAEAEKLDDTILLPLAILHDVGYSEIQNVKSVNYYNTDIRRAHMDAGAKIARELLEKIGYPEEKIEIIVHDIAVHDNWAFGEVDIYTGDPILGTFKDLDYLWIYTEEGCHQIQKTLQKNDQGMLDHLRNETSPIHGKKPFSNESTKALHDELLRAREAELSK